VRLNPTFQTHLINYLHAAAAAAAAAPDGGADDGDVAAPSAHDAAIIRRRIEAIVQGGKEVTCGA